MLGGLSRKSKMEYFLRQIVHDNSKPVEIQLESNEITIGRCIHDLLPFRQASRNHAKLRKINDKWFIEDLKSVNGVFINQLKITKEEELQIGDHIGLGIDNPSIGFVCALSARVPVVKIPVEIKKEPIEVIELSDDDDYLPIKVEQLSKDYDGQGCSWNLLPPTHGKRENLSSKHVNSSLEQEFSKESFTLIKNISFSPINQNLILNSPSSSSISNLGVDGNSSKSPTQKTLSLHRFDEVKPVFQKKNDFPGLKWPLNSPNLEVKAFSSFTPAFETVSNHKISKVEQGHQKSNVPSLKLKNSNLSACAYKAPYRNPKSQSSTSSDFKPLSPRISAQNECLVPKRNEFVEKQLLKKPFFPSLYGISSNLTDPSTSNVFPAYSVLKNCGHSMHDIPYKNQSCGVRSQLEPSDRSPVQSPTIRPKKENFHSVETSFGTPNSASSYLTQNPIDTNMKDNLTAVHNNLFIPQECYVKLKRCDETECENDSAKELRFIAKRKRISSDSDEENAEEVINTNLDDDDDYYIFNPSQKVVKKKPTDEEELDVNDEHVADKMTNNEISPSETVEDVRKFIELTRRSSLSELTPGREPMLENFRLTISSEDVEKNVERDFSLSSLDDILIPSKLKAKLKPSVKKSSGRTLRTTTQSPRNRRGRGEWFERKRVDSPLKQPEKGFKPKPKKSPFKNTAPNWKNLKDFKHKTPDKKRTSVLSAVEVPIDENYFKAEGTSRMKKKVPVIARIPGKLSRSGFLTLDILATSSAEKVSCPAPRISSQKSCSTSFS